MGYWSGGMGAAPTAPPVGDSVWADGVWADGVWGKCVWWERWCDTPHIGTGLRYETELKPIDEEEEILIAAAYYYGFFD